MDSSRGATAILALVLLTALATPALLWPIVLKIVRRRHKARSGALEVLHDPANAQFEFVNTACSFMLFICVAPFTFTDFLALTGSLLSMALVPIPNTPGPKQSQQLQPTGSRIPRPRHLILDSILRGCTCCAIYYHAPSRKLEF